MVQALPKSRLAPGDLIRTAIVGIRMRKLRSALSSLGIVIGVAAMVGILGLAESSKSELLAQLDRLGTNLLIVESGTGFGLGTGALPTEATGMIARIGPVESTSMISFVGGGVYTNDRIPEGRTGGISIQAVDTGLLDVLAGSVADGVWLGDAKASYRTVVLGSVAARRLGVREVTGTQPIWLGGRWFTVIGVLNTFELSPDLDRSALIGHAAAATFLDHENLPTRVLARVDPARVDQVVTVLAATANPEFPEEVEVDKPTDALEAKEAANDTLTALFLGLGAVALLVGSVGVANVMVISVLERRGEIGLRRALGATQRQVAAQFLGEALLLGLIGGIGGVLLGVGTTVVFANVKGWDPLIPPFALLGGLGVSLVASGVAGLYPAVKAAHLSPTEALRTT
jgi:putative ABC transport system permease protein